LPLYILKYWAKPGHHLLLKCDSSPEQLQIELLAGLHFLGVSLYLCAPKKTVVMQEMDCTYGRFKSQYRRNMELLVVNKSVRLDRSVSVPQLKHVLIVFGSVDPNTGLQLEAFELGFSHNHCIK
jgi:hypothetical protein